MSSEARFGDGFGTLGGGTLDVSAGKKHIHHRASPDAFAAGFFAAAPPFVAAAAGFTVSIGWPAKTLATNSLRAGAGVGCVAARLCCSSRTMPPQRALPTGFEGNAHSATTKAAAMSAFV